MWAMPHPEKISPPQKNQTLIIQVLAQYIQKQQIANQIAQCLLESLFVKASIDI